MTAAAHKLLDAWLLANIAPVWAAWVIGFGIAVAASWAASHFQ